MKPFARPTSTGLAALGLLCASNPSHAADDWEWKLAPYLWAASIGTDLETDRFPSASSNNLCGVMPAESAEPRDFTRQ